MFLIVDDHGELIGKFPTHEQAQAALDELIEEDPIAADDCGIVEIDDRTGRRVDPSTLHTLTA
jgi:hypothetical protein